MKSWLHFLVLILLSILWVGFYIFPSIQKVGKRELEIRDLELRIDGLDSEKKDFQYSNEKEESMFRAIREELNRGIPANEKKLIESLKNKFTPEDFDSSLSLMSNGKLISGIGRSAEGTFILGEKKLEVSFRDQFLKGLGKLEKIVDSGLNIYPSEIEILKDHKGQVFILKGYCYHMVEGKLPQILLKRKEGLIDGSSGILRRRVIDMDVEINPIKKVSMDLFQR